MDEELNFERFVAKRANLIYGPGWQGAVPDWLVARTQQTFSLQIRDKLHQTINRSIELSKLTKAKDAVYNLRFGAGRRLMMMWDAYSDLLDIAPPDRKEPTTSEESRRLTQDLNSIYVNIRGTLDNLCWALLHEHAPDKVRMDPSKVGLFLPCIVKNERFNSLATLIQTHDSWSQEVKTRRDPAAHRIPLTVPPQLVTPEEESLYEELSGYYLHAVSKLDFDEAEATMQRMHCVGRFVPYFIHDPKQGVIPIYSTVPDDIGHVIDLFRAVETFLVRNSSSMS